MTLLYQSAIRSETSQLLVSTVLRADRDRNLKFTDREIDDLTLRLEHLPGVKLNHDALKRRMSNKNFNVSGVFEFVKELENEDSTVNEEDRVFTIV